jgi:hypothetical protein
MDEPPRPYWFPAKQHGWGWGPPATWQGWLVLIAWLAVVIPGSVWLGPRSIPLVALFLALMVLVLMLVCYVTGEPPRWRRGDDDRRRAARP